MRIPLALAKFSKYEYWPMWLFYIPVLPYWFYLAVKNKSLAYFTVANPSIELGGFFGESKTNILNLINSHYLPKAVYVDEGIDFENIVRQLQNAKIDYPIIAKPDIGERGYDVAKLYNEHELLSYAKKIKGKYIIQEFINYEIELGVLYSRMPNTKKGKVTSVTLKKFLSVTGDGTSTILQLMQKKLRARFQIKRLSNKFGNEMNTVLTKGEVKLLEPIGNHCRGTTFIDNNFLINEKLNTLFDEICLPIKGFYYGRFDLKVKKIEDLHLGKNIKIMELNGVSSEPGHIYDPYNSLIKAYTDLCYHWKLLSDISYENIKLGFKPVSFWLIIKSYWKFVLFKKN